MNIFLKLQLLIVCAVFSITQVCEPALAQDPVTSVRLLGANSPAGDSYDDLVSLDGGAQLIANDTLSATTEIFNLNSREYLFQARYSSVSGAFVADTSQGWFANFRLTFDSPTTNDGTYFFFEDENGPIDLSANGFGGDIGAHPFDPSIPEVAFVNTSRDPGLEHQFGIFSNPFTSITGELGVDATTVTGFGVGAFLTTVPEPSMASLLLAVCVPLVLRRNRSRCNKA